MSCCICKKQTSRENCVVRGKLVFCFKCIEKGSKYIELFADDVVQNKSNYVKGRTHVFKNFKDSKKRGLYDVVGGG